MSTVSALIRRGDTVLLVRQQAGRDDADLSYLPGGVVESGEYLHNALVREVREETGVTITDIGHLAWGRHLGRG